MKKRTFQKLILILLLITATSSAQAQTWKYTYDANGNRTARQVVSKPAKTRSVSDDLFTDEGVSATIDGGHNKMKVEILRKERFIDADIIIYDLSGREVLNRRMDSEVMTVDLGQLHRGTYILTIEQNGEKKSCKFSK